jgi:hypothetical protein
MPIKKKNTKISTSGSLNILSESQIRNALNSLFYEANKDFLSSPKDISEYDVQTGFFKFLKYELKNKGLSIRKERQKYDISIQLFNKKKIILDYVFEMKTFIKKSESISFEKIIKDVKKLQEFISNTKLKNKKAFFLVASTQNKLVKAKGKNKLFSDFCIYNNNRKEFENTIESEIKVYRSFFIGSANHGNNEPILNQIRFFLFELK